MRNTKKLTASERAAYNAAYFNAIRREDREAVPVPEVAPKRATGGTRFTTDYAVAWGRRQGWKLIERERFDVRTMRHHDLELGTDAIFDDGGLGRVAIQAAGAGERAAHLRRFEERGGVALAARRGLRVVYVEFERGNREPVKEERWA